MEAPQQKAPWQKNTGFIASHCQQCAAGWTRAGKEGGILTVCLLDREPVPDIVSCNRFEKREPTLRETAAA